MMKSKMFKVAASGLVLGATLVGCSPSTHKYRPVAVSAKAARNDAQAAEAYQNAQKAVAKGDLANAMAAMENAVALSPTDAGYRKGLAEMYLKNGRFASAEQAYSDVIALHPGDAKAPFYLALSQLAQGRTAAALAQLATMDQNVAPADLGLAYALAGEAQRGIALLEPAARGPESNGRVRQNLALAYALAGDWKRARVTAAQDMSPADLNPRLAQWAALANPAAGETRVANLLGVTAVSDPGQPARLALSPAAAPVQAAVAETVQFDPASTDVSEPVAVAVAEPVAPLVAVDSGQDAPVQIASAPDAPVAAEAAPVPALYTQAARSLVGPSAERGQIIPTAIPAYLPSPRAKPIRANFSRNGKSKFVVQVGAYRSSSQVENGWANLQRRYALTGATPLSTTVRINGKGVFHRLSIAGFDSQASAVATCRSIRAKGGACFVRANAGDAPVQWASRYTRKTGA